MSESSTEGDRTSRAIQYAGYALLAVVAWLSLGNVRQAAGLQTDLDRDFALQQVRQAIQTPLVQNQPRDLRDAVSALVGNPALGLKFLLVKDLGGVALAAAGDFENLDVPLSSAGTRALRNALYRLTSHYDRMTLTVPSAQGGGTRPLASLEYAISGSLLGRVENAAVHRLRWTGWAGLLLSGLIAAVLTWLIRRQRDMQPHERAFQQRISPQVAGDAKFQSLRPAHTAESQLIEDSLQRTAGELDALGFGVIVVQREGKVSWLNPIAESLCGWSLEDARDRLVYSVFHPVDENGIALTPVAEIALRDEVVVPAQACQLKARSGVLKPVEMMAAPLRDTAGLLTGAVMMFRDVSARHAEMQELRRQSRLSQGVIDHLDEGLIMTDPAGVVRFGNARTLRMFGYSRNELDGVTVTKLIPVPFLNTPGVKLSDYIASKDRRRLPRVVGWRKDATTFPVELLVQPISVDADTGFIVILRDITERLRGENLATRLGRLLDNAVEEIYIFDAQTLYFLEINRGARNNLGYRPEQLTRMTPMSISSDIEAETFQQYLSDLRGGVIEHKTYRCQHRRANGTEYPVEVRLNFSREEEPPVFMAIAVDISSRIEAENRLKSLAHQDALTGLPNRVVFLDRLEQACLAATRSSRQVAVMFMDLDHFKQVNDRHGHEVGDQVLLAVAGRLKAIVRSADTVARLGGDEFVIVAPGIRDAADAEQLARKIVEGIATPLDIPGLNLRITLSLGIALYPTDDSDGEGLIRHADTAMYEVKKEGRNGYRLFDSKVNPERQRTLDLERGVHLAVALNQFHLLMTPVVDTDRRLRAGYIGICWDHPVHGRVAVDEALRAASRAGLLADLEAWIVCRSLMNFHNASQADIKLPSMIVPLSGWQLRDEIFVQQILHLMDRFSIPPRALVFALTGDGYQEASSAPEAGIRRLLQRGVRFALRNFDEGFAALNRDSRLPLFAVLMAPEFGHGLHDNPERSERLKKIVETAEALEKLVIVTAVSDEQDLKSLVACGAQLWSGPHLSPPIDTRAAADWLKRDDRSQLL